MLHDSEIGEFDAPSEDSDGLDETEAAESSALPNGASTVPGSGTRRRSSEIEHHHARARLEFLQLAMQNIQNPVAILDMSMRLLLEDLADADAETVDTLRGVEHAVRRIQRYIDHLVTSEEFAAGRMEPQLEPLDMTRLLNDLVEDFGRGARACGIDLRLASVPSNLILRADETLLQRVLQSLLEHAVCRVVRDGRVLIEVRAQNVVEIRVSNDGARLSPAERARVFDKYGAGVLGRRGSGPGLYFCRLAVEAHGGTVSIESSEDWPTSFVVRLPMTPL